LNPDLPQLNACLQNDGLNPDSEVGFITKFRTFGAQFLRLDVSPTSRSGLLPAGASRLKFETGSKVRQKVATRVSAWFVRSEGPKRVGPAVRPGKEMDKKMSVADAAQNETSEKSYF